MIIAFTALAQHHYLRYEKAMHAVLSTYQSGSQRRSEHPADEPCPETRPQVVSPGENLETRRQELCPLGQQPAASTLSRVLGLIPARYASTRFPGKPLHLIAGKPLIQHVVERCRLARSLTEVIVATDDERIAETARRLCRVEMTRPDHPSGTDRIAEVAARCDCEAVVNIQGDEPLIDASVIDAVAMALDADEMSTAATLIKDAAQYQDPNVVKVVVNSAGRALYFSRRTIPYLRDAASRSVPEQLAAFPFLKHLGIYGYRRQTLLRLVQLPVSPLEHAERLEQLRALENGIPIAVVRVDHDSVGVDVPADVARVEALLSRRQSCGS